MFLMVNESMPPVEESVMPDRCPESEVLVAYLLGKLDRSELETIAEHVAHCPTCENNTEALEAASDTFIEYLGGPLPESDIRRDPEYQRALAHVQALRSKPSARHTEVDLPLVSDAAFLGEYRLLGKLGQGGMGVVWKAEHQRMHRLVAIKTLHPSRTKSPDMLRRFCQEVEVAAKLLHPNIVTAFDAREHEGQCCLVMEYVDGQDLARLVKQQGPLPPHQAADYMLQAARGLQFAHSKGVIHRDVKPSNLLLDREGTVKILDLGLARVETAATVDATSAERVTPSDQVLGTCDYMAPEQAMSCRAADVRSDIYALGCTLFRLLTARLPYEGDTPLSVVLAHCHASLPSAAAIRGDVPVELDAICQKMMAKRPEDRYQAMAEVVAELEGYLGTRHAPQAKRKSLRRNMPAILCAAAAALAVCGLFIVLHFGGGKKTPLPTPEASQAEVGRNRAVDVATAATGEKIAHPLSRKTSPLLHQGQTIQVPVGMVFVPAGAFLMGADTPPVASPPHRVEVPAFFIDKYEVTNAQYGEFVRATGHVMPEHWRRNGNQIPPGRENHPVTCLRWWDAEAYARWCGKRLPTEAEWEKAAAWDAAKSLHRKYPWGDAEPDQDPQAQRANTAYLWGHTHKKEGAAWHDDFPKSEMGRREVAVGGATKPVGSFPTGVSPAGCYDMAGNAAEWVQDWFDVYPGPSRMEAKDRAACGTSNRVFRDGGWFACGGSGDLVCAGRLYRAPTSIIAACGLRCAADYPWKPAVSDAGPRKTTRHRFPTLPTSPIGACSDAAATKSTRS
jgi:formylglycine-generating enzyme required for sulfatase activity/tRNA A-37 threonylcarbamoyl transferase component Bud32